MRFEIVALPRAFCFRHARHSLTLASERLLGGEITEMMHNGVQELRSPARAANRRPDHFVYFSFEPYAGELSEEPNLA